MVLYIAYSGAGQLSACMCQISQVYDSLRKRYESTLSYFWLTLVIGLSDKITHMTMKIVVSPEYDYEKRHFHSNRLILVLSQN